MTTLQPPDWTNFVHIGAFIEVYQDSHWHRIGRLTHLERPPMTNSTAAIHLKCDGLPVFLTVSSSFVHEVAHGDQPIETHGEDPTYRILWRDGRAHLFRAKIQPD